jgi:hypothetical protein
LRSSCRICTIRFSPCARTLFPPSPSAVVQVDEIDAPLAGGGVVEAECLSLDAEFLVGAGDVELLEVSVAVEEFVVVGDAVVHHPGVGVVEAVGEAADGLENLLGRKIARRAPGRKPAAETGVAEQLELL